MDEKSLIKTVPNSKNISGFEMDQGPYLYPKALMNGYSKESRLAGSNCATLMLYKMEINN